MSIVGNPPNLRKVESNCIAATVYPYLINHICLNCESILQSHFGQYYIKIYVNHAAIKLWYINFDVI